MIQDEKNKFDGLTDTSYLFRLIFERAGFEITSIQINGKDCWHLYYKTAIVGAVTTRLWETEEDSCTFTNLHLYKYFTDKFPKVKDFRMSEFYEYREGKRVKFSFDKFDDYIEKVKKCSESLVKHDEDEEDPDNLEDAIARLKDFCDEFDEKFSNNTLFKDVRALLNENERLNKLLKEVDNGNDTRRSSSEEGRASSGAEEVRSCDQDSEVGEHSGERSDQDSDRDIRVEDQDDRRESEGTSESGSGR